MVQVLLCSRVVESRSSLHLPPSVRRPLRKKIEAEDAQPQEAVRLARSDLAGGKVWQPPGLAILVDPHLSAPDSVCPESDRRRRCRRCHGRASCDEGEWRHLKAPSVSLSSSASHRLRLHLAVFVWDSSLLEPLMQWERDPSINGTSTHLVPVPRFGSAYLVRGSRLRPRTL
jgi:hypothetical protein